MAPIPPPQGLNEGDYETIETAVTETVRGRWFLAEFARRNRSAEIRQVLDAIGRIESVVTTNQAALPGASADPSIRLLIQRIKDVAVQLDGLGRDMREAEVDAHFVEAVELQARAVSGLMRGGVVPKPETTPPRIEPSRTPQPAPPRMPRADLPPVSAGNDPRLATLSGFDGMPLAKKLAFFT